MRLPEDLENELWHDIEEIEGERKGKYVTSVERLAIKRNPTLTWHHPVSVTCERNRGK